MMLFYFGELKKKAVPRFHDRFPYLNDIYGSIVFYLHLGPNFINFSGILGNPI